MKTTLITILFICSTTFSFAADRLIEIKFFGIENPDIYPEAPCITFDKQVLKKRKIRIFKFEDVDTLPQLSDFPKPFYIQLIYKIASPRQLKVFWYGNEFWVLENDTWKLAHGDSRHLFENLILVCSVCYEEKFDILLWSTYNQVSQLKSDSIFAVYQPKIAKLALPENANELPFDQLKALVGELIRYHLIYYEELYSFHDSRELVLQSFEQLARDLAAANLPTRIAASGEMYKPFYELQEEEDGWVCYVASDVVSVHFIPAWERFNAVLGKDR